jgi:hypothetical protein
MLNEPLERQSHQDGQQFLQGEAKASLSTKNAPESLLEM